MRWLARRRPRSVCGRFNSTQDPLAKLILDLADLEVRIEDRFNIAPTDRAPVLVNAQEGGFTLREMQWWLVPYWSREPKPRYSTFNARAEGLERSRAFKEPFARRRALVPATGFYEWVRRGGRKQPWYLRYEDGSGMLFAGLWDRWHGDGQVLESFAVITTAVHPHLAFVHDRQPAMLSRTEARIWMDPVTSPETLRALLRPVLPRDVTAIPVSSHVNNARHKDSRCIEAIGEARHLPASSETERV